MPPANNNIGVPRPSALIWRKTLTDDESIERGSMLCIAYVAEPETAQGILGRMQWSVLWHSLGEWQLLRVPYAPLTWNEKQYSKKFLVQCKLNTNLKLILLVSNLESLENGLGTFLADIIEGEIKFRQVHIILQKIRHVYGSLTGKSIVGEIKAVGDRALSVRFYKGNDFLDTKSRKNNAEFCGHGETTKNRSETSSRMCYCNESTKY